jgi:hypothetical protein
VDYQAVVVFYGQLRSPKIPKLNCKTEMELIEICYEGSEDYTADEKPF